MRKNTILFIGAFWLSFTLAVGQNQQEADSLKEVLKENKHLSDSLTSHIIFKIVLSLSSPDEIITYTELLEEKSLKNDLSYYTIQAYLQRGIAFRFKGDIERSLKYLLKGLEIALEKQNSELQAEAYMEIAATYYANDNLAEGVSFERKGIEIMRNGGRDEQLGIGLLNIGFSYYSIGKYDSALMYYEEAAPIFENIDLAIGKAYLSGNKALVMWKRGDLLTAEKGLLLAIEMLKSLGDQYGMADYHNQLGSLYFEKNEVELAVEHANQALSLAKSLGLKEQIRDAVLLLSKLSTRLENYKAAYDYQSLYILYKDSIENSEQIRKIAGMRTLFEVNLREKEIDLLEEKQKSNRFYILVVIILLVLAVVFILYMIQRNKTAGILAIAERKQHNNQVRDLLTSQENKALESMVQGRDHERRRLAQELHNHFGSLLATIKVNINAIHEEDIPNHHTITTLVDQACHDMRNISHSLNMGISENFGLIPALQELVKHLTDANHLKVEFEASMFERTLTSKIEIIIYRIVQELVSNVLKHASATKLSILLTFFEEEGLVNILVQDNGKGFNQEGISTNTEGMGLQSLIQLVEKSHGDINFDSNATSGTTVTIDLPIAEDLNPFEL